MRGRSAGMSTPPEGVLAGESVPRENEQHEFKQSAVEKVANLLKTHPAYEAYSEDELKEVAWEYLNQMEGN